MGEDERALDRGPEGGGARRGFPSRRVRGAATATNISPRCRPNGRSGDGRSAGGGPGERASLRHSWAKVERGGSLGGVGARAWRIRPVTPGVRGTGAEPLTAADTTGGWSVSLAPGGRGAQPGTESLFIWTREALPWHWSLPCPPQGLR